MSLWADRLRLARAGWHSATRIQQDRLRHRTAGARSFGIWARRHDWHGRSADICFHAHATIDLEKGDIAIERMRRAVLDVVDLCTRATALFPDAIPCQVDKRDTDGGIMLAVDSWQTRQNEHSPRRPPPIERIPEGLERLVAKDITHEAAALQSAARGLYLEDRLDPFFGPPRMVLDPGPRDWGDRVRLAVRQYGELLVRFQPIETTTRLLDEESAARVLDDSARALLALFERAAPDFPPGFEPRTPALAPESARDDPGP